MNNRANASVRFEPESLGLATPEAVRTDMGSLQLLRTVILTPLVLAIAGIVLLAIGVHFAWDQLARRRTHRASTKSFQGLRKELPSTAVFFRKDGGLQLSKTVTDPRVRQGVARAAGLLCPGLERYRNSAGVPRPERRTTATRLVGG